MTPKKGQPPKGADKRKNLPVHLSPTERGQVEEARNIEAPDRRLGAYVRDVVLDHAEEIIQESTNRNP